MRASITTIIKQTLIAAGITAFSLSASAQTGNVGIGTTNPQAKLHVAGKVRIDSLQNPTTGNYVVMSSPTGVLSAVPSNVALAGTDTTSFFYGGAAGADILEGKFRVDSITSTADSITTLLLSDYYVLSTFATGVPNSGTFSFNLPNPTTCPQKVIFLYCNFNTDSTTYRFRTTKGATTYSTPYTGNIALWKFKSDGVKWYVFVNSMNLPFSYFWRPLG